MILSSDRNMSTKGLDTNISKITVMICEHKVFEHFFNRHISLHGVFSGSENREVIAFEVNT